MSSRNPSHDIGMFRGNSKLKAEGHIERVSISERNRRAIELERCSRDIVYFAEKYFYIMSLNEGKVIIKLYEAQKRLLEKLATDNFVVCLSSRQSGKTTTATILYLWLAMFHKEESILIGANKFRTAKNILSRIKMAFELMPQWLVPSIRVWNVSTIVFGNDSRIDCISTSSDGARGESCKNLCIDEAAHLGSKGLDFWTSTYPTISSSDDGRVFLISTANGMDDLFYPIYENARIAPNGAWSPHTINYWDIPGRETDEWRIQQIDRLGSEEKFMQEFGNSFLTTGSSLLNGGDIDAHKMFINGDEWFTPELYEFDALNPSLKWKQWFKYEEGHAYIIGADVADGTGGDSSVGFVFDITRIGEVKLVASFTSNMVSTSEFAYALAVISTHYKLPYMMVEANSIGRSVVTLLEDVYEYENIVHYGGKGSAINSNQLTKMEACIWFKNIHIFDGINIVLYDKDLVNELEYFCRSRNVNGGYKAMPPYNDDHVLAAIWALFGLTTDIIDNYYNVLSWESNKFGMLIPSHIEPYESVYSDSLNKIKDPSIAYRNEKGDTTPTIKRHNASRWMI